MKHSRRIYAAVLIAAFPALSLVGCSTNESGSTIRPAGRSVRAMTVRTASAGREKRAAYREGRIPNIFALAVNTDGIRRAAVAEVSNGQVVLRSRRPAERVYLASGGGER